jgi:hypothetical protein
VLLLLSEGRGAAALASGNALIIYCQRKKKESWFREPSEMTKLSNIEPKQVRWIALPPERV